MATDNLLKKFHLINFTVRMLIIGFLVFCAVQMFALHIVNDDTVQPDSSGFYGHNYCGTFFIDITCDNSFIDEESYTKAIQPDSNPVIQDILLNTASVVMVLSLLIFLHRADKQTMHSKRTAWLLFLSGGLYAAGNTVVEIQLLTSQTDGLKGIMATQSYYPQLYAVYGIPLLLIAYGLILLYYEQISRGKSVIPVRRALKICTWLTAISIFGFMLWRFIIRCYELFSESNARLPFYSVLLDLPKSECVSDSAYTKVLLLRFVKDLPVFAASAIAVLALIKLMHSAADGQINTTGNRRQLKFAALALAVSSVIFNLLGLVEVNMLNESFTGIYGDVTYTIGIRSGCEPMLYAFLLIIIEIYLQAIPQTEKSR
ncbi:MAG: hypothetical protein J6K17_14155 [Oscillospiraceae bacterium]|nr:hypothetical protein [Oscillospiraceae bacterium]